MTSVPMDVNPNILMGKFGIAKADLNSIAYACQDREFAEDVDKLEAFGGESWIEKGLKTSFNKGIPASDEDIHERDTVYGHNRKHIVEPKSYFSLLMMALEDFTMRVLMVAAIISIVIEVATATDSHRSTAWIEGFAILVAVAVCANVTAINDYQKERQFQKLNSVADERKRVTIWRNGTKVDIHQTAIFVGDVIQVFEGMEIPADCLVLEASELTSDESAMTGETDPIKKNILQACIEKRNQLIEDGARNTAGRHDVPSPIMMSGTRVLSGEGKMVVLVVGDASCVGKISVLLRQDEPEATPLQMKLEAIAEDIGKFGLISAIIIVIIMVIRFGIEKGAKNNWQDKDLGELLNFFIIGITVVVVAIPEGLPLAVTLSLAYSTKKMLNDNNLVRKMAACETMGGASMICSDKTGTLTQNKMTLVNVWNDEIVEIDTYSAHQDLTQYFPKAYHEFFIQTGIVNATAMLRPEPKGSKTEIALLEFIEKCGINYENERERNPTSIKFPFSSARKRMSMVLELEEGKRRLVCKGASEMVLAACSHYHSKATGPITMDEVMRNRVEKAIETMAGRALRTICLAYKEVTAREDLTTKDLKGVFAAETSGLILVAVLGIKDILRQEVPRAISLCRLAGIKVRMVTGDNKLTAKAIAKECGIIEQGNENSLVMEGSEFIQRIGGVICKLCKTQECDCPRDSQTAKQMRKEVRVDTIENQKEFDRIYPFLDVLARSRPEDKYALVTGLIERGHVVAVTGDGTNDAPALKKADVGFAMGIAGTEVAREAAAIILLDDNFNSIVKAVMWGRNIYDSIKKFLQFQLTVNVVAVGLTLVGAAIIKQEVLKPIQMLWVNLIMDTFASLALATESPTEKLLYRKPHNRNEYIITKKMFKHILCQSVLQLIIMLILTFDGPNFLPEYVDALDYTDFKSHLQYKYRDARLISKSPDNNPYNDVYTCLDDDVTDQKTYCQYVASGRLYFVNGEEDYYPFFSDTRIYSRHFTYIFNTFVMLQLFNFINARRILDEFNVFERILTNYMFPLIVITIFMGQVIITTFGSVAFGLYPRFGLQVNQWGICIGFGCLSIPFSVLVKFLKEELCCEFGSKEVNPLSGDSKVMQIRQSHNAIARRFSSLNPGYQMIQQQE